jgi:hypothetical protein
LAFQLLRFTQLHVTITVRELLPHVFTITLPYGKATFFCGTLCYPTFMLNTPAIHGAGYSVLPGLSSPDCSAAIERSAAQRYVFLPQNHFCSSKAVFGIRCIVKTNVVVCFKDRMNFLLEAAYSNSVNKGYLFYVTVDRFFELTFKVF